MKVVLLVAVSLQHVLCQPAGPAGGAWGSAVVLPEDVFENEIAGFLGGDIHNWLRAGGTMVPTDLHVRLLQYQLDCQPAGIGQFSKECSSQPGLPVRYYTAGPGGRSTCCYGLHNHPSGALRQAAAVNRADRVGLLLQGPRHGRADPSAWHSESLRTASKLGHASVVKLLLRDGRADPLALSSAALRDAAEAGHTAVVRLLLHDHRQDPTASSNSRALIQAARRGHGAIVRLLLIDRRADPSANESQALRLAASQGHLTVVQLLLADGRSDPSARNEEALRSAMLAGFLEVAGLLRIWISRLRLPP
jgi:Ankyrin repeats (3 copies)